LVIDSEATTDLLQRAIPPRCTDVQHG